MTRKDCCLVISCHLGGTATQMTHRKGLPTGIGGGGRRDCQLTTCSRRDCRLTTSCHLEGTATQMTHRKGLPTGIGGDGRRDCQLTISCHLGGTATQMTHRKGLPTGIQSGRDCQPDYYLEGTANQEICACAVNSLLNKMNSLLNKLETTSFSYLLSKRNSLLLQ